MIFYGDVGYTIIDDVLSLPEKLTAGLGGNVIEGDGSRVKFSLNGVQFFAHRPHPNKEAKKYQIESFREFLEMAGIKDE